MSAYLASVARLYLPLTGAVMKFPCHQDQSSLHGFDLMR